MITLLLTIITICLIYICSPRLFWSLVVLMIKGVKWGLIGLGVVISIYFMDYLVSEFENVVLLLTLVGVCGSVGLFTVLHIKNRKYEKLNMK